ncbi:MAG: energy-coupled thiamine transporter ThiT [Lachnospiraceae bacterium]|nr:energy-coupled thiamine transporter ThiT [Lachnospiraceae bacterium]MDD7027367.1 energy-coupled thiamine transporter ThiT [Lachnospiraceae bacterium]MDY5700054.1 energy-coupled thiamine transporter ThiT [Lachnospiraceae bacterium]
MSNNTTTPSNRTTEQKKKITTRQIVFSAMAIALATVIAVVIKLPSLPNGGSVTLFSMLIVTLVGYWYGPVVGITAAVAYGILQFITGPYVVHPAQVILDYPLAFGALGLSGFFKDKKNGLLTGYIVGVIGRFFWAMVSGLIFYTEYVDSLQGNMAAIWASTAYNLSYLLPEAVLTIILISLPAVKKAMGSIKAMATGQ